jgi:chromosome segregation ATPase
MHHKIHISQISLDLASDEIPEVVTINSSQDSDQFRSSLNDHLKVSLLETQIESHLEEIKKLKVENYSILKERDEVLEEYEDELKATKSSNEGLSRENLEIKKEIKILYSTVEQLQMENEKLQLLNARNRELELIVDQNKKFIKQLQENNKVLSKTVKSARFSTKVENDTEEIMMKYLALNSKYNEGLSEIERLRIALMRTSLLYAESETEREGLQRQVKMNNPPRKFSWKFWKFWRN